MKTYSSLFTLALFLLLTACVRDPEPIGGDPGTTNQGPILEFIISKNANPLPGAIVGISKSRQDRDDGVFLSSRTTGSTGRAEFKNLIETTYWYNIKYTVNGAIDIRDGEYSFVPGQNGDVRISF